MPARVMRRSKGAPSARPAKSTLKPRSRYSAALRSRCHSGISVASPVRPSASRARRRARGPAGRARARRTASRAKASTRRSAGPALAAARGSAARARANSSAWRCCAARPDSGPDCARWASAAMRLDHTRSPTRRTKAAEAGSEPVSPVGMGKPRNAWSGARRAACRRCHGTVRGRGTAAPGRWPSSRRGRRTPGTRMPRHPGGGAGGGP